LSWSFLLSTIPSALLRRVKRAKTAFYDVVDVGEVTSNLAGAVLGFENSDGFTGEDGFVEEEVSHVRATPRTVNGEETDAGDGETVDMVVSVGNLLVGFFGGGVERSRTASAVELGEGVFNVETINRGRGSPNNGRLRVGGLSGDLEKRNKADDVGGDLGMRVAHGLANAGLGGEMEDVSEWSEVEESF